MSRGIEGCTSRFSEGRAVHRFSTTEVEALVSEVVPSLGTLIWNQHNWMRSNQRGSFCKQILSFFFKCLDTESSVHNYHWDCMSRYTQPASSGLLNDFHKEQRSTNKLLGFPQWLPSQSWYILNSYSGLVGLLPSFGSSTLNHLTRSIARRILLQCMILSEFYGLEK